jgi:hypothetical protein
LDIHHHSCIDVAQVLEGEVSKAVGPAFVKELSPKRHIIGIIGCAENEQLVSEKTKSTFEGGSELNGWRTLETF